MRIRLAEPMFVTLQGEGQYTGRPSIFVRLTGCNFRCEWANGVRCDTPYSSWEPECNELFNEEDFCTLQNNNPMAHLVVTGGEPFMHPAQLSHIIKKWNDWGPVTIETNGSFLVALPIVQDGLLSISPKLNTNEKHDLIEYAEKVGYLTKENANKGWRYQIKFVAQEQRDFELFDSFIEELCAEPNEIFVMACGTTKEEIDSRAKWIADECLKRGWNYSDRLHLRLWGGGKGR